VGTTPLTKSNRGNQIGPRIGTDFSHGARGVNARPNLSSARAVADYLESLRHLVDVRNVDPRSAIATGSRSPSLIGGLSSGLAASAITGGAEVAAAPELQQTSNPIANASPAVECRGTSSHRSTLAEETRITRRAAFEFSKALVLIAGLDSDSIVEAIELVGEIG